MITMKTAKTIVGQQTVIEEQYPGEINANPNYSQFQHSLSGSFSRGEDRVGHLYKNHHYSNIVFSTPKPQHSDHDNTLNSITSLEAKGTTAFRLKAEAFCCKIQENHARLLRYDPDNLDMNALNFTVLADALDMVAPAENMFALQDEFRKQGKDVHVDIGYHYTQSSKLSNIRKEGLLTKAQRRSAKIQTGSNGGTFGDGVYTGNNPFAYHGFAGGDVCIFVARLKGQSSAFERRRLGDTTVLGRFGQSDEVCVLQSSMQCLSLVHFSSGLVSIEHDANPGNAMVYDYHCSVQHVVDEFFNSGKRTMVPPVAASSTCIRYSLPREQREVLLQYEAPDRMLRRSDLLSNISPSDNAECPICLNDLTSNVVELTVCGHKFHEQCIHNTLNVSCKCPICRSPLGLIQGSSPSGTMRSCVQKHVYCLGFSCRGAIMIEYVMEAGVQREYHQNPNEPYPGTQRTAYLPNNDEGHDLLRRLQFAFCAGLTFTVGKSLTTERDNVITWASIHHKTSLNSCYGAHSYPDPSYFSNVNEELDALRVPKADDL